MNNYRIYLNTMHRLNDFMTQLLECNEKLPEYKINDSVLQRKIEVLQDLFHELKVHTRQAITYTGKVLNEGK